MTCLECLYNKLRVIWLPSWWQTSLNLILRWSFKILVVEQWGVQTLRDTMILKRRKQRRGTKTKVRNKKYHLIKRMRIEKSSKIPIFQEWKYLIYIKILLCTRIFRLRIKNYTKVLISHSIRKSQKLRIK
jgi:hypothetical protein